MRTRLVVSVPVSIAEPWLLPRVAKRLETFPLMAIDMRVEEDPLDLARQNIDVRISYGDYHYPGLKVRRLAHDDVLHVCAPAFITLLQGAGGD